MLLEVSKDFQVLKEFSKEVKVASPETVVAAVYHSDAFGPTYSENTLLLESMRSGVCDCFRRPLSKAELEHLLDRLFHRPDTQPALPGVLASFVSNKGGVGKSTLAINVACLLAKRQREPVLLVDAGLQMGVCATMLNLKPATSITDAVRERHRLDETLIRQFATPHECGLDLLAAPANAVEAAEVDDEILSRILTLARRAYTYVLVDTFPLLDRVMMSVLDMSDRTYLVLESVVPTILGAVQLMAVLDGLGLPRDRQRVVLNRYSTFGGNIKPEGVALRLGRAVDHVIPYEKKLLIAANVGIPYVLTAGRFFSAFPRQCLSWSRMSSRCGSPPSCPRHPRKIRSPPRESRRTTTRLSHEQPARRGPTRSGEQAPPAARRAPSCPCPGSGMKEKPPAVTSAPRSGHGRRCGRRNPTRAVSWRSRRTCTSACWTGSTKRS